MAEKKPDKGKEEQKKSKRKHPVLNWIADHFGPAHDLRLMVRRYATSIEANRNNREIDRIREGFEQDRDIISRTGSQWRYNRAKRRLADYLESAEVVLRVDSEGKPHLRCSTTAREIRDYADKLFLDDCAAEGIQPRDLVVDDEMDEVMLFLRNELKLPETIEHAPEPPASGALPTDGGPAPSADGVYEIVLEGAPAGAPPAPEPNVVSDEVISKLKPATFDGESRLYKCICRSCKRSYDIPADKKMELPCPACGVPLNIYDMPREQKQRGPQYRTHRGVFGDMLKGLDRGENEFVFALLKAARDKNEMQHHIIEARKEQGIQRGEKKNIKLYRVFGKYFSHCLPEQMDTLHAAMVFGLNVDTIQSLVEAGLVGSPREGHVFMRDLCFSNETSARRSLGGKEPDLFVAEGKLHRYVTDDDGEVMYHDGELRQCRLEEPDSPPEPKPAERPARPKAVSRGPPQFAGADAKPGSPPPVGMHGRRIPLPESEEGSAEPLYKHDYDRLMAEVARERFGLAEDEIRAALEMQWADRRKGAGHVKPLSQYFSDSRRDAIEGEFMIPSQAAELLGVEEGELSDLGLETARNAYQPQPYNLRYLRRSVLKEKEKRSAVPPEPKPPERESVRARSVSPTPMPDTELADADSVRTRGPGSARARGAPAQPVPDTELAGASLFEDSLDLTGDMEPVIIYNNEFDRMWAKAAMNEGLADERQIRAARRIQDEKDSGGQRLALYVCLQLVEGLSADQAEKVRGLFMSESDAAQYLGCSKKGVAGRVTTVMNDEYGDGETLYLRSEVESAPVVQKPNFDELKTLPPEERARRLKAYLTEAGYSDVLPKIAGSRRRRSG